MLDRLSYRIRGHTRDFEMLVLHNLCHCILLFSGFQVADKGCCGTGNLEVAVLCNQHTSETCADVSDYVFWDSYHPTEKAYKALVYPLLGKYLTKFF